MNYCAIKMLPRFHNEVRNDLRKNRFLTKKNTALASCSSTAQ